MTVAYAREADAMAGLKEQGHPQEGAVEKEDLPLATHAYAHAHTMSP